MGKVPQWIVLKTLNIWKTNSQHHEPVGKNKSELLWDITSSVSEWLISKRQGLINASRGVQKEKPYTHIWWKCKLM